ncbi:hypothetical protein WJX77_000364 [Trebouxia sp. C0004]
MLQGLVIKDLTTGQMYGLDMTSSDACGESTTHLADIATGRKITLDEFSGVLGHDSTFTCKTSNIRMLQPRSSDTPSLYQLPAAATSAPNLEPGLQAPAHGLTGSPPSHGGQADKDGKQQQPDSRFPPSGSQEIATRVTADGALVGGQRASGRQAGWRQAERLGWDEFSRYEQLNPQGVQELRAQRQASGFT